MRKAILTRVESGNEGTFGTFTSDSGFSCHSGELPWRDNEPNLSCIPCGMYTVEWGPSPKHGNCYHVLGVPGRSNIEIHPANFMGVGNDLRCDLLGCIALGLDFGVLYGQKAILSSWHAVSEMEKDLGRETFLLTIQSSLSS